VLSYFPFAGLGRVLGVEGCAVREGQSRGWELIAFPAGSGEIVKDILPLL